jgi:hypothetical protein
MSRWTDDARFDAWLTHDAAAEEPERICECGELLELTTDFDGPFYECPKPENHNETRR